MCLVHRQGISSSVWVSVDKPPTLCLVNIYISDLDLDLASANLLICCGRRRRHTLVWLIEKL